MKKIFSVDHELITEEIMSQFTLIHEMESISPYYRGANVDLIIEKHKQGNIKMISFFNDQKSITQEIKDLSFFSLFKENENCNEMKVKVYRMNDNNDVFLVKYSKEEMKDLTLLHIKDNADSLAAKNSWIGVDVTLLNMFQYNQIIKSDFDELPRLLNKTNVENFYKFLNLDLPAPIEQIIEILDCVEDFKDKKYGVDLCAYKTSECEYKRILNERQIKTQLPYTHLQMLEMLFIDSSPVDFELNKNDLLGAYYREIMKSLSKIKQIQRMVK